MRDACHKKYFAEKFRIIDIDELPATDLELISRRTSVPREEIKRICLHHHGLYLSKYSLWHKKCCDPFDKHRNPVRRSLRIITLDCADRWAKKVQNLIPGRKICTNCYKKLQEMTAEDDVTSTESEKDSPKKMNTDVINSSLELCSVSPLKLHGKSKATLKAEAQRKIMQTASVLLRHADNDSTSSLNIIKSGSTAIDNLTQDEKEKIQHSDHLCHAIKNKIKSADKETTLQLLTLIPDSWSIERARKHLEISARQIRNARRLKKIQGILPRVEKKRGRALSQETKDLVVQFYQDEEFSRTMPGKKDCIYT